MVENHSDSIRFIKIQSEMGLILTVFPILINPNHSDHGFILISRDKKLGLDQSESGLFLIDLD